MTKKHEKSSDRTANLIENGYPLTAPSHQNPTSRVVKLGQEARRVKVQPSAYVLAAPRGTSKEDLIERLQRMHAAGHVTTSALADFTAWAQTYPYDGVAAQHAEADAWEAAHGVNPNAYPSLPILRQGVKECDRVSAYPKIVRNAQYGKTAARFTPAHEICNAEHAGSGYTCTLTFGHRLDHVAYDNEDKIVWWPGALKT